jgi:hypothetical protein
VSPFSCLTWPYRYALCWVRLRNEENLLRLITKDWYKPKGPVRFGRLAFQPNGNDTDGISLYREQFVTPEKVAASVKRRLGQFYVVQLRVSEIRGLRLTLRPTVGELPGHVIIKELKWSVLQENRDWAARASQASPTYYQGSPFGLEYTKLTDE